MKTIVIVAALVLYTGVASAEDLASLASGVCDRRVSIEAEVDKAVKSAEAALVDQQKALAAATKLRDAARARTDAGKKAALEKAEETHAKAQDAVDNATAKVGDLKQQQALRTTAFDALCVDSKKNRDWTPLRGHDYPALYVESVVPGACANVKTAGGTDVEGTANELCEGVTRTGGGFGAVAINLALGLGDFLQARAKQEVLEYMMEHLAKKFCLFKRGEIELQALFATTCKKLFPDGTDKDVEVDADAFNFGELKDAFVTDLRKLPENLAPIAIRWIKSRWNAADKYLVVAGALYTIVLDLHEHKSPAEILEHLGQEADARTKDIVCDFTVDNDAQKKLRKVCAALLLFQVARTTGAVLSSGDEVPRPSAVLNVALVEFCKVHGGTKNTNGACVIDPKHYTEWHDSLLRLYRAAKNFADLHKSLRASTELPAALGKRAAPETIAAIRELIDSFTAVLVMKSPADANALEANAKVANLVLDVYVAVTSDDPAALRKGLIGLLELPNVGGKLGPKAALAITTVVTLGTAKDRDEVKDTLDDVAAKVGTYKNKYNADHRIWMINSFVGFFGGGEYRVQMHEASGDDRKGEGEWAPLKLATPVGLDITLASWKKKHFGLFVSAIDPLALDVREEDGALTADWKTILLPGLHVRFGLAGPIVLSLDAMYAFGRRAPENSCGTERCFDGALQFGASISADVPIFELNP